MKNEARLFPPQTSPAFSYGLPSTSREYGNWGLTRIGWLKANLPYVLQGRDMLVALVDSLYRLVKSCGRRLFQYYIPDQIIRDPFAQNLHDSTGGLKRIPRKFPK